MNSNSMDEDVNPQLSEKSNEDYMETCDNVLPRLQRLAINENDDINDETMDLPSDCRDIPCHSMDTINSPISTFEDDLIANSNKKVTSLFVRDESGNISVNEATKVVVDNRKQLHGTKRTVQIFSSDILDDIRPQNVLKNALDDGEINRYLVIPKKRLALDETKGNGLKPRSHEEKPIDLSVKHNMEHHNQTKHSFPIPENKAGVKSLITGLVKLELKDAETGELMDISSNILLENSDLEQHVDETANDIFFINDSPKLYFADASSDDQSSRSSEIIIDSPPNYRFNSAVNAALVANKRPKKISVFVPPIAGMSETRQRRFGIFQPHSLKPDATATSKTNSSSDEDNIKPRFIKKVSPLNSKRRCRKIVKTSPISRTLNPSILKNDEEKRPSPYKRKKESSENLDETAGKFRKRSLSEHNAETGEKTRLAVRSRSLSASSKNRQCFLSNRQFSGISLTPHSRKRTSSKIVNTDCIRYRNSSISSD